MTHGETEEYEDQRLKRKFQPKNKSIMHAPSIRDKPSSKQSWFEKLFGFCYCPRGIVVDDSPTLIDMLMVSKLRSLLLDLLEYQDILRLRRTCHHAFKLIKEPEEPVNRSKNDFKQLLHSDPIMGEYINSEAVMKLWMNVVFGGSVLRPIRGAQTGIGGQMEMSHFKTKKGKQISKPNCLKTVIKSLSDRSRLYQLKTLSFRKIPKSKT